MAEQTLYLPEVARTLGSVVGLMSYINSNSIFSGLVFAMNLKVFNLGLLRPSFTPQDVCLSVQVLCKHCADYEI